MVYNNYKWSPAAQATSILSGVCTLSDHWHASSRVIPVRCMVHMRAWGCMRACICWDLDGEGMDRARQHVCKFRRRHTTIPLWQHMRACTRAHVRGARKPPRARRRGCWTGDAAATGDRAPALRRNICASVPLHCTACAHCKRATLCAHAHACAHMCARACGGVHEIMCAHTWMQARVSCCTNCMCMGARMCGLSPV